MKHLIFIPIKVSVWLLAFSLAACSAYRISATHTPVPTPTNTVMAPLMATNSPLPLSGKIAYLSLNLTNEYQLKVMDLEDRGIIDITPPGLQYLSFLSWSPDGQFIAFLAWKDHQRRIFIIRPDGSELVQLAPDNIWEVEPSWSPDGQSILFVRSASDIIGDDGKPAGQMYVMRLDRPDMHRIVVKTRPDNISVSGSFRGDGLIAVSEPVTRFASANYVIDIKGEIQNRFPKLVKAEWLTWSPDGDWVAYSPDPRFSDCSGIELMKYDRSESTCLLGDNLKSSVYFGDISWSPDGKYILFSSNLGGNRNIYAVSKDGSRLVTITDTPDEKGWPVWSIIYQK